MTNLDLIKFDNDSANFAGVYGFQETNQSGKLLHLYDVEGEQLDGGNGNFPNASWEFVGKVGTMDDSEDFWGLISEVRWCEDHLTHLSEHVPAAEGSDYCEYCTKKYNEAGE